MLAQLRDSPARAPSLLQRYAESLVPWARETATRMIGEVDDRERASWRALGIAISGRLHRELQTASVGARVRELLDEQVALITSIPRQAAERAQQLATEAVASGLRPAEVAAQLEQIADVTHSRALLIARTETARASTVLLQARCESVGASHYIWRTARDSAVRPGHRVMEGKVCEWADPPAVLEGDKVYYHHPGEIWNCRCYAEPIISEPEEPVVKGRRRS